MNTRAQQTKDRLLDAASRVVCEFGYEGLTLEAVAQAAGVSKGGLLYHYASKETLVTALVARQVKRFESRLNEFLENEPHRPGRWTKAYIKASLLPVDGNDAGQDFGLIAAVAMNPTLLDPLRDQYSKWKRCLDNDSVDSVVSQTMRFAVDGIWLCSMLNLGAPTVSEVSAMATWMITSLKEPM